MPESYTSEDFDELAAEYEACAIKAALRIASRVMRPGVIEKQLAKTHHEDSWKDIADGLRAALTEDTPDV